MKKPGIIFMVFLLINTMIYADSFTFGVICDTRSNASESGENGVNVAAVNAVCQHMKKVGVQFVIAPGDFICGNVSWYGALLPTSDTQYQTFLKAAAAQGIGLPGSGNDIILYPVRGNHECYHDIMTLQQVKDAWIKNMGRYVPQNGVENEKGFSYTFRIQNTLFVGIDQFMHADAKEKTGITINQTWLDNVLKNNPDTSNTFIFGHTPAFSAHHQDCLAESTAKRDAFLQSVYRRSGTYFCGHDHFYARGKIPVYDKDGKTIVSYIQQVITPTGAPFLAANKKWNGNYSNKDVIAETYIDNTLGYQLVTVTDKNVNVKYIATQDGCYFDEDKDYSYPDNWQDWQFVVMDQYTYNVK